MKTRIVGVALACFGCTLLAAAQAAEIELQSSMEDALKVASQAGTTGTNVRRAEIETRKLRAGTVADVIEKAASVALKSCPGDLKVRLAASDLVSRDFVGDTSTRLSGLGIYVSMAQRGNHGSGTGFIAPFVSVHMSVTGPGLKQPREFDVTESERIEIARSDSLEFITANTGEIERAVISYAARVVEQRLRKELAPAC